MQVFVTLRRKPHFQKQYGGRASNPVVQSALRIQSIIRYQRTRHISIIRLFTRAPRWVGNISFSGLTTTEMTSVLRRVISAHWSKGFKSYNPRGLNALVIQITPQLLGLTRSRRHIRINSNYYSICCQYKHINCITCMYFTYNDESEDVVRQRQAFTDTSSSPFAQTTFTTLNIML